MSNTALARLWLAGESADTLRRRAGMNKAAWRRWLAGNVAVIRREAENSAGAGRK